MRNKKLLILFVATVAALSIWRLSDLFRPARSDEIEPGTAQKTPFVSSPEAPGAEDLSARAAAAAADDDPQVQATRRMYMAHASLRSQEVADPDSEANLAILNTMVKKAIGHSLLSERESAAASEEQPSSNF